MIDFFADFYYILLLFAPALSNFIFLFIMFINLAKDPYDIPRITNLLLLLPNLILIGFIIFIFIGREVIWIILLMVFLTVGFIWAYTALSNQKKLILSEIGIKSSRDPINKLKQMMKVSDQLTKAQMALALGIDHSTLDSYLERWKTQYSFKVNGELVIFNQVSLDEFLGSLDDMFEHWKEPSNQTKLEV